MNPVDSLDHVLAGLQIAGALREQEEAHRAEVRALILRVLDVLDAMDRVLRDGAADGSLLALRRKLVQALEHSGVHFLSTVGECFDPERHVAVEVRDEGASGEQVVAELVRGCLWHDELLRPAQVVVCRPAAPH